MLQEDQNWPRFCNNFEPQNSSPRHGEEPICSAIHSINKHFIWQACAVLGVWYNTGRQNSHSSCLQEALLQTVKKQSSASKMFCALKGSLFCLIKINFAGRRYLCRVGQDLPEEEAWRLDRIRVSAHSWRRVVQAQGKACAGGGAGGTLMD